MSERRDEDVERLRARLAEFGEYPHGAQDYWFADDIASVRSVLDRLEAAERRVVELEAARPHRFDCACIQTPPEMLYGIPARPCDCRSASPADASTECASRVTKPTGLF